VTNENLVRALDAVYHELVKVEGDSPEADAMLDQVHALILRECPDADEYAAIANHARPEREPHEHGFTYHVTLLTGPVMDVPPALFRLNTREALESAFDSTMDWLHSAMPNGAEHIEQVEVIAAECYTDPMCCNVRHTLGVGPDQDTVVYRRPLPTPEGATHTNDND